MEEIYQDLSNPASKEFEQLLNSQFSKYKDIKNYGTLIF